MNNAPKTIDAENTLQSLMIVFKSLDLDALSDSVEANERASEVFLKLAAYCQLQKVWVKLCEDKNVEAAMASKIADEMREIYQSLPVWAQW